MPTGWVLRDGDVLAAAEIATGILDRTRGLIGRRELRGAYLLPRTRSVHSVGMRFPLDVAFLDRDLNVVDLCVLVPWRVARPRRTARSVLEAEAGAFERWGLRVGDRLEFHETT